MIVFRIPEILEFGTDYLVSSCDRYIYIYISFFLYSIFLKYYKQLKHLQLGYGRLFNT